MERQDYLQKRSRGKRHLAGTSFLGPFPMLPEPAVVQAVPAPLSWSQEGASLGGPGASCSSDAPVSSHSEGRAHIRGDHWISLSLGTHAGFRGSLAQGQPSTGANTEVTWDLHIAGVAAPLSPACIQPCEQSWPLWDAWVFFWGVWVAPLRRLVVHKTAKMKSVMMHQGSPGLGSLPNPCPHPPSSTKASPAPAAASQGH